MPGSLLYFTVALTLGLYLGVRWYGQKRKSPPSDAVYDYIIVGGGTAGCVLANRLSEDPSVQVLLIEAGGFPSGWTSLLSRVPIMAPFLQRTSVDWAYMSAPQKHSFMGLKNNQFSLVSGKVLGGSTFVNALIYSRGNRRDYDRWAEEGCAGWNYSNVLPYFIKSENNHNTNYGASGYHGTSGPLHVGDVDGLPELTEAFISAGVHSGYQERDLNGEEQIGFMKPQGTVYRGERHTAYDAYITPILHRGNLHIRSDTMVTKVLISASKKAVGVVTDDGDKKSSRIRTSTEGEVILSSGTIGSAKILMNSGIGPKDHLDELKIPVHSDLPVGNNLKDHPFVGVYFTLEKPISITQAKLMSPGEILRYIISGKGYYSMNGLNGMAFLKTSHVDPKTDQPDIQLQSIGVGSVANDVMKQVSNYRPEIWEKFKPPNQNAGQEGFIITVSLLVEKSSGTVRLDASDPLFKPVVDFNFFSDLEDVERLAEGIQMTVDLIHNSPTFQTYGAQAHFPSYPECSAFQTGSLNYFRCLVKMTAVSIYHVVGTCKMGAVNDTTAVVDPELRVKGVDGLRVVDASIMPTIPSGNTMAPVIMIGEKAADVIKSKYTPGRT